MPRHPEKDDEGTLPCVRRRRRAITPSRTAPKAAKQWAGEAAKASSDGDASSEIDAAAVASWPQWERLPGGGSGGHGDDDDFFVVLCGAGGDYFRVVLFVLDSCS